MSSKFYTSHLMGGLGNQMFQIAHTIARGWKDNVDTIFYIDSDVGYSNWQTKIYADNIFRNLKFTDKKLEFHRISEESFNEANLNIDVDTSIEFYGYFQSSKNFLGYEQQIRNLFSPSQESTDKLKKIYNQINYENTLSIHIRKQDYHNISNVLPVIDVSYIEECVRLNGEYDCIFIFSDDKIWAKNTLKYKNSIVVDGIKTEEEMWLMSMCKNNIICNSTFSWWGSFLNNNTYKKVYAPSIWFGPDGPKEYNNLYESYWKIVDVNYVNGRLVKT